MWKMPMFMAYFTNYTKFEFENFMLYIYCLLFVLSVVINKRVSSYAVLVK